METLEAEGKMFRYDMGNWGGIVSFDRRKRNHFITLKDRFARGIFVFDFEQVKSYLFLAIVVSGSLVDTKQF